MNAIHRKPVEIGREFTAPKTVTFAFQADRQGFSVWYNSADSSVSRYIVIATGTEEEAELELRSTVCVDGFHVFHLCEIAPSFIHKIL